MKTTEQDMKNLFQYMEKVGAKFTVDKNPSSQKIEILQYKQDNEKV